MARGKKRNSTKARRIAASPQATLDAFASRVQEFLESDEHDQYMLGAFWNELVKNRYVEHTKNPDFPTPAAWWHERLGAICDVRTAERLGGIAKHFDAPAMKYGEVFLDDLIIYARRYRIKLPRDPSAVLVTFTTPDGEKVTKTVSQLALKEMEWALAKPKSTHAPKKGDDGDDGDYLEPTPLQRKWITAAQDALGWDITQVRNDRNEGDWTWDVNQIFPDDTRRVLSALLDAYEKFAKENGELK